MSQTLMNTIRAVSPYETLQEALDYGLLTLAEYVACLHCERREQGSQWRNLFGLAPNSLKLLLCLSGEHIPAVDLADRAGVSAHNMDKYLRQLEQEGYAQSVREAIGGASHRLYAITPTGERLADAAFERVA